MLCNRLAFSTGSFALSILNWKGRIISIEQQDDTREKLIVAALSQFAERGFYGASIAQIAGEVGLTKQALLYHFKRKEDLYSEVLRRIAQRIQSAMHSVIDPTQLPEEQFEAMLLGLYSVAIDFPQDTKVLMRELVDDQRRDAPEEEWYLRMAINRMVDMLDQVDALRNLTRAEKLARVYSAISAVQFFAGSSAVLRRFYGLEEYAAIRAAYPDELRTLLRQLVQAR